MTKILKMILKKAKEIDNNANEQIRHQNLNLVRLENKLVTGLSNNSIEENKILQKMDENIKTNILNSHIDTITAINRVRNAVNESGKIIDSAIQNIPRNNLSVTVHGLKAELVELKEGKL